MTVDLSLKKSITASVIASILVILFIQPLVNIIFKYVPQIVTNISANLSNSYYENAALGNRDWFSFLILEFMLMMIILFGIGVVASYKNVVMGKGGKTLAISIHNNETAKKFIYYLSIIINIVGVLAIFYVMSTAYTDLQLNSQFQQRLNIIRPYISEAQMYSLKSNWALMKSRIDYLEIDNTIKEIALKNNIILPKPLIK